VCRTAVISAAERRGNVAARVIVDDTRNDTVGSTYTQKGTDSDEKPVEPILAHLDKRPLAVRLVVVEVQITRETDGQRRGSERTRQTQDLVEDRNALCNDERDSGEADGAAEPRDPVHRRVLLQVLAVLQDADEEVLGGDVHVQHAGDKQPEETDAVGYFLQCWTRGSERWRSDPDAAPAVDDEGEAEVAGCYDQHATVQRFLVVVRVLHLGDDGQEGRGAAAGDEDGRRGVDALHECRRADGDVAEFEGTGLWCGGGSVAEGDADDDDQDRGVDGCEAHPCHPAEVLELANTCSACNNGRDYQDEQDGADGVVGQGVQSGGGADKARRCDDDPFDDEERSDGFSEPDSTDHLGHVCDGVTASVSITKIAHDDTHVCVESAPAEDVECTWDGS